MPRIELMDAVLADLERIVAHLHRHESVHVNSRAAEILAAIDVLRNNPHIGRPAEAGRRELVIGRKQRGYVALYRFADDVDVVFVLAIRGQREASYLHD